MTALRRSTDPTPGYAVILGTFFTCVALVAGGCAAPAPSADLPSPRPFQVRDLAKSDIDDVVDLHVDEVREQLRSLANRLYKRNPRELNKSGLSADARLHQLFGFRRPERIPAVRQCTGAHCIEQALAPDFAGDRVYAFVFGLTTMLEQAYNHKRSFYMLDDLDPQKLYNSARNIEVAAWKLRSEKDARGEPVLLSHARPDEEPHFGYERLFGKLIAHQDMMARIVAGKTNRTIKGVVMRLAGFVFLPI
ncbi:MAG: hypothetical protein AAF493_27890 [Pseudomonadota bacterium]